MNKMIVLTLYTGQKIVIGIDDIKFVIESNGVNYNSEITCRDGSSFEVFDHITEIINKIEVKR